MSPSTPRILEDQPPGLHDRNCAPRSARKSRRPPSNWCWCARLLASARPRPWRRSASASKHKALPPRGSRSSRRQRRVALPQLPGRACCSGWAWTSPAPNGPFDAVAALAAHAGVHAVLDDFEVVQEPAVLAGARSSSTCRAAGSSCTARGGADLGLGCCARAGSSSRSTPTGCASASKRPARSSGCGATATDAAQTVQALPAADLLSQLHHKTEGWVAAIWLASMALERHGTETGFVERFSGSDTAPWPTTWPRTCSRTSRVHSRVPRTDILRQLDARCARRCAACRLRRLSGWLRRTLLTPVSGEGGDGGAWRYHSPSADFLRAQLAYDTPGETERWGSRRLVRVARPARARHRPRHRGWRPTFVSAWCCSTATRRSSWSRATADARALGHSRHQLREHPFLRSRCGDLLHARPVDADQRRMLE